MSIPTTGIGPRPTITDEEKRHDADELRARYERAMRQPGEIHYRGRKIGTLRRHWPDRQAPALPIITYR